MKGRAGGFALLGNLECCFEQKGNTEALEAEHRKHREGRATQHEGSYMEMGSLAWRETYQQGFSLA